MRIQCYDRYLADRGYIAYCLGVPGAIFLSVDPNHALAMVRLVAEALVEGEQHDAD